MGKLQQNYLAVDVETTGLLAGIHEVIEIGAVKIIQGKLEETYQSFICPKGRLPIEITELTGITKEMLSTARPLEAVLPEFLAFAGDMPLLGHNLPFDYSFLKAECNKLKISFERNGVDTLSLAKALIPDLKKRNLASVTEFYHIDSGQAHRAEDDAIACAKIYLKMLESFGADITKQELFLPKSLQARIKKSEPATIKQKKYLLDLLKYHKIEKALIEHITKSDASKMIDYLQNGQAEKAIEILNQKSS